MPSPAGPSSPAISGEYRYQNFDVEIRKGPGEDYTVSARTADTGETTEVIPFPFNPESLEHRQDKLQIALGRGRTRQICAEDERPVRDFGTELFFGFFPAGIRGLYEAGRTRARQESMGLRIRLHLDAPELATLPWEFLYDPRHGDYISLSRDIPVVRYIDVPAEIRPLRIDPPIRILCMVASPNDRMTLDVEREKDQLKRAIRPLMEQGLVEMVFSEGQTWRDLMQKMREGPFHIFHFIGHGGFSVDGDEGFIALRADNGCTYPLSAQQLARLLADHTFLRLVVLNSCEGARGSRRDIFSSTSSILVRRGIPAVVAMQYPISDEAAIEFSRSFYESLVSGLPVDTSMAEARKAMSAAFPGGVEWGTPVLYMRSQDGVLFTIDRSRPRTPHAVPVQEQVPVPVKEKPAAQTRTCTACGNTIQPGQKYCSKCLVSVHPVPAVPAAPAAGSSLKPADGTRFCTECGNTIPPGDMSCSRCHTARTPAPAIKPAIPGPHPSATNVDTPPAAVPVKTGTDAEPQPARYPAGFYILGILNVLGALFVLWINGLFLANASVPALYLVLMMSGIVLLICGIMMIFRQPKISHPLLLLNFFLAGCAYLVILAAGPTLVRPFDPITILFWFILFILPGACVSVFFYPLKNKYHV